MGMKRLWRMDVGGRLPVAWFGFGFCSGLHERFVYSIAYIDKQSRYSWYNVFMIFAVKALRYVSLRLQSTMVQSWSWSGWLKHRPKGVPPWGRRLAGHILHHTSNGPVATSYAQVPSTRAGMRVPWSLCFRKRWLEVQQLQAFCWLGQRRHYRSLGLTGIDLYSRMANFGMWILVRLNEHQGIANQSHLSGRYIRWLLLLDSRWLAAHCWEKARFDNLYPCQKKTEKTIMVETSLMSLHGCALASKPKPPGQLPDSRTCVAAFTSFLNVTNNHRLRYLRTPAIATVRTKNMHLSQWMFYWCLFVLYPADSCRFHMQPNDISFSLPCCPCRHCPKTPECHVSLQIQAVDWDNTPRICRQKT